MQSPCRNEVSEACFEGCCPTPLNFPTNQVEITRKSTFSESRRDFSAATTSSIFPKIHFTNHESIPSLQEAFSVFIKAYPHYRTTRQVDKIRAKEYFNLSISSFTCLDYIGIGLFSYSQLQKQDSSSSSSSSSSLSPLTSHFPSPPRNLHFRFFDILNKTGNLKMQLLYEGYESELESGMKKRIFRFLGISENDYSIVFTANRTSAFKLLAESYPFESSNKLLTVYDYESEAVDVMISSSEKRGAEAMSAEFSWPRMRIRSAKLREMIVRKKKKKTKTGLFVFPLHSRVTGARYPYLWMSIAQENRWHILIDACALGPKDMDSFGLSLFRPDFLVCSFYKVFGENPSGFGCLFVKKSTIQILEDSFNAGIVSLVQPETEKSTVVQSDKSQLAISSSFSGPILSKSMKNGDLEQKNSKNIENSTFEEEDISEDLYRPEMECKCLDQVDSLGLTQIATRARCLINWLVSAMMKLKHPNPDGDSLIRIYGPKIKFDRGGALAFNVFDWKGEKVEPVLVQKLADRNNISLSYGFLHHIWFSDKYAEQKGSYLERRVDGGKGIEKEKRKSTSENGIAVVTAAFGFLTNFEDAYKLWTFIAQFLDPDFVEKERWRYTAQNQNMIKV